MMGWSLPLPCHAGRARICRFATLRCSRAMACAGLCGEILCTSGKVPKTRPWSLVEDRCRGQRRERGGQPTLHTPGRRPRIQLQRCRVLPRLECRPVNRWLAGFYVNLLKAGFSATLIDPHGDLAPLVLSQLVSDGYCDQGDAPPRS
jgi:hypothetical protein